MLALSHKVSALSLGFVTGGIYCHFCCGWMASSLFLVRPLGHVIHHLHLHFWILLFLLHYPGLVLAEHFASSRADSILVVRSHRWDFLVSHLVWYLEDLGLCKACSLRQRQS